MEGRKTARDQYFWKMLSVIKYNLQYGWKIIFVAIKVHFLLKNLKDMNNIYKNKKHF